VDSLLLTTVGLIFLTAFIGVYLRRRSRDRCLRDFAGFQVSVLVDGKRRVWGRLEVFSSGIELRYREVQQDREGHHEASYVLFTNELAAVQSVRRYHDELSTENQGRRNADLLRTYHPGLARRGGRGMRNFFNTFRDAFNQSLGALLSAAGKRPGAGFVKSHDAHLNKLGSSFVGAVANAYEPILERYIGCRVVIEAADGDGRKELAGILKEYTGTWIELLGVRMVETFGFPLGRPDRLELNRDLDFIVCREQADDGERLSVRVENHGDSAISLVRLTLGDWSQEVAQEVAPGGHAVADLKVAELPEDLVAEGLPERLALRAEARKESEEALPAGGLTDLVVVVEAPRDVDLCLPRASAVLRHGGEWVGDRR